MNCRMSLMNVIKTFLKIDLSINQSIEKYNVDSNKFDRKITLRSSIIVFVIKSIDLRYRTVI